MIPVVFADELPKCEDCGEPYCLKHKSHYADCSCLGPSEAADKGYELIEKNGKTYARKPKTVGWKR